MLTSCHPCLFRLSIVNILFLNINHEKVIVRGGALMYQTILSLDLGDEELTKE
jgi:hypothetical protein